METIFNYIREQLIFEEEALEEKKYVLRKLRKKLTGKKRLKKKIGQQKRMLKFDKDEYKMGVKGIKNDPQIKGRKEKNWFYNYINKSKGYAGDRLRKQVKHMKALDRLGKK
ncbi:MAG: hypothetical protein ACTSX6_02175 [Candidatus Heimdallarchaeaceae archaeon]